MILNTRQINKKEYKEPRKIKKNKEEPERNWKDQKEPTGRTS